MKSTPKTIRLFIGLTLALAFISFWACEKGKKPEYLKTFPGESWEYISSPESVGYSPEGLEAVRAHADSIGTTGLVVVVHGKVLMDYGNITELSYIASVRKSVLAMLFGSFVADGTIDMNKTLADLNITDHGGLTEQEQEATITDLISARSGVYHEASNSGDNLADAPPRGSQKHGTYYLYSNWDFNALGTIFEQETSKNIYDVLESNLAILIGMQDFDREAQRKSGNLQRSMHPAYHMWFSTRDMARIGYVMLRDGIWEDKTIVPKKWVKKITSPITVLEEMNPERYKQGRFGYGYLWWIFDGPEAVGPFKGGYTGIGAGGQYITVLPELDLVVAHKTNRNRTRDSVSRDEFLTLLDLLIAAKVNN